MKRPFSTAFYFLLCAVLVVFGVLFGAYRGWRGEAEKVKAIFEKPNGIATMLNYSANDAANLEKVALRHISKEDATLKELRDSRLGVADEKADLHSRFLANEKLTATAAELSRTLLDTPSVKASQRDTGYVNAILKDMDTWQNSGAFDEYNAAADELNRRLDRSLSGLIAKLLFVKPARMFE